MYIKEEYIGYGTNELPKLSDEELEKEVKRIKKELSEYYDELNSSDNEFPVYTIKENIKNSEYDLQRVEEEIANRANNAKLNNGVNNTRGKVATEDVGTMLPQVGLNGQQAEEKVDPKEILHKATERPVVSAKLTGLVTSIYNTRKKLYYAKKMNLDQTKINSLKLHLMEKEHEFSIIKNSASPNVKRDIEALEERLNKNTKRFTNNEKVGNNMAEMIKEATEEKKEVPADLKRLDEIRAVIDKMEKEISDLKDDLKTATDKLKKTGEQIYENKVKGISAKIESITNKKKDKEEELSKKESQLKKEEEKIAKESAMYEAADMEDEIRPIVEELNRKGYSVKYASPGHKKLRKKEDKEPDGVYYGKLYSDARIMFKDTYSFPPAPEYWHWREVDGCSYLDISPITYNSKDGSPNEAFDKWKTNYMNSLRKYVDDLKSNGSAKKEDNTEEPKEEETKESTDEFANNMIDAIYENMNAEEAFSNPEAEIINESTEEVNTDVVANILQQLDDILS